MFDTDDMIRMRVLPSVGTTVAVWEMGKLFFQLLHSDPFVKHWYYDAEGYKLCTLRYPIMKSFRKMGLSGGRGVHSASRPL